MSVFHYPTISVDGLILCVDAANSASYAGTGSSWYDLSGNNNHLTLVNTPYYSSSNKGGIGFTTASSHYAYGPTLASISNFTLEAWIKVNESPLNTTVQAIITQQFPGTNSKINYSLGFNGANGTGAYDGKINGGFYDGTWRLTDGFTPIVGTWYHTAVTYNGASVIQYVNGSSFSTLNYVGTPTTSGGELRLMRRWDTTNYLSGILPIARIYNRALSAAEILANYNSMKGRFNL